jgi:hypothetical protein
MTGTAAVVDVATDAANSRPMGWLARVGLTARGLVYVAMGWLAVLLGTGAAKAHVDQRGVLAEILGRPAGTALVWLMTLGFAAYAVWRFSEAAFGVTGEAPGAGPRLKSLARGLAYSVLAFSAFSLLNGARATQSGQQGHLAGTVMQHTGGRLLVGVVGLVVIVVGLLMVHEGWSKKFLRYFGALPAHTVRWVVRLGRVGTVARGIVFAVTGFLVLVAAWSVDPTKAGGIDVAFRTLLEQPYGAGLVALLGIGLVIFGVYGLAEAAWRRVTDGTPS